MPVRDRRRTVCDLTAARKRNDSVHVLRYFMTGLPERSVDQAPGPVLQFIRDLHGHPGRNNLPFPDDVKKHQTGVLKEFFIVNPAVYLPRHAVDRGDCSGEQGDEEGGKTTVFAAAPIRSDEKRQDGILEIVLPVLPVMEKRDERPWRRECIEEGTLRPQLCIEPFEPF